jgi:transposase
MVMVIVRLPLGENHRLGLKSKLHAVCDGAGRPVIFILTEGQMSDHKGAALIYPMLPDAETLIADKGYDSDAFREALAGRGITPSVNES